MEHAAPALFVALEQSGFGVVVRQSVWIYPAANVGHILALFCFAGAIAVMDLRLIGAFTETSPARVIGGARRVAMGPLPRSRRPGSCCSQRRRATSWSIRSSC